jgi:signal transduction histidine kinase
MPETIRTTGGLDRITANTSRRALLLVASSLALLAVALFEIRAWRHLGNVEAQLQHLHPDTFQLGKELQSEVTQLNAALLRFELSNDSAERGAFQKRTRDLKQLLASRRAALRTSQERTFLERAEQLFESYLAEVTPLLEKGMVGVRRDSAAKLQEQINRAAAPLLQTANHLIAAQEHSFHTALAAALAAATSAQRSIVFSGLLLILLVAAIAASLYFAMVSPLRAKLTETRAVVERQEKLASLGTLATGVAHEIRNPLTAIKFRLFSLKKSLPAAHMDNEDVAVINSEINRLERLVKDFLQFARPAEPQLVSLPAQRVLHDVQALLGSQVQKCDIRLLVEDANGIWLHVDRQQIEQVLINLVQNGAESIGRDGSITLRARHGLSKVDRRSMPVVILEVTDTGKGIPGDAEARIFDPFFSTKEAGTGLGLSIAARIVEMHGGYIQYQSAPGRGTTFSIVLPRPSSNGSPDINS